MDQLARNSRPGLKHGIYWVYGRETVRERALRQTPITVNKENAANDTDILLEIQHDYPAMS